MALDLWVMLVFHEEYVVVFGMVWYLFLIFAVLERGISIGMCILAWAVYTIYAEWTRGVRWPGEVGFVGNCFVRERTCILLEDYILFYADLHVFGWWSLV